MILLLPIVDILTSLSERFLETTLSIGILFRSFMMLYFTVYILFITKSKHKRKMKIFLFLTFIYTLLYFILKSELLSSAFLFTELSYLFKILFFPVAFMGLICYFDDYEFDREKLEQTLKRVLYIYIAFLLIPLLTKTAFNTYIDASQGYIGWFYSGNEISSIIVLLFPFLYILLRNKPKTFILSLLIAVIPISFVGTKVTLFGLYIVSVLIIIVTIFMVKKNYKPLMFSIIALLIIFTFMHDGYSVKNMNRIIAPENAEIEIDINQIGNSNSIMDKLLEISLKLLSSRDIYILNTNNIYVKNLNASNVFFGLGFSNTPKIDDINITKLTEVDLLDLFYHTGIFGLLISLLPYFYTLAITIKNLFQKKAKLNVKIFFYGMMILLSGGIACLSGHALLNPAVSMYIALYLLLLLSELNYISKTKINKGKIEIITLHLGYGGAERATVDLANILESNYQVELLSLYRTEEICPFKINDNIKVTYLSNLKPNRQEFKCAVKEKNILKILKEGAKSVYILLYKHFKTVSIIENSNSEYLISSRYYFTRILNTHGREKTKKIAIEHNFNISKKYITKTKKSTENIDKLVLVSKTAANTYKKTIEPNKINYIPNIVSDEYQKTSNLQNKSLISVGRLEPEKGSLELIELLKKVHELDKDITLDIFGDGSLKPIMENKIDEYGLKKIIKLHGFKSPKEIEEKYSNSSLFVLTSYKESFGIVLVEAMKCGIPVIAFDRATGAKEIIKNDINGYLIKDGNLTEMANTIVRYMREPKKKKLQMQKNAIKTASQYTLSKVQKEWLKLLKEITNHD